VVEERLLEDTGREDHLVQSGVIVSVHSRGSHLPGLLISRLANVSKAVSSGELLSVLDVSVVVIGNLDGSVGPLGKNQSR